MTSTPGRAPGGRSRRCATLPSRGTSHEPQYSPCGYGMKPYRGSSDGHPVAETAEGLGQRGRDVPEPPGLDERGHLRSHVRHVQPIAMLPVRLPALSGSRYQTGFHSVRDGATLVRAHVPPPWSALPPPRHPSSASCAVIAPRPGDCFLEIGPGQGALTLPLARRPARRRRRARLGPRPTPCGARAQPTSRSWTATPWRRTSRRSCPRAPASSATCPTTSRARSCGASSTWPTTSATCT